MTGKVGRPPKAAKSLAEALRAVHSWHPPLMAPRPRNAFERQAMRRQVGRKPRPNSPTRQAAAAAQALARTEGLSATAAARRTAAAFGVNADNVRRYMRELGTVPTVRLRYKGPSPFPIAPVDAPLLAGVVDADNPEIPAPFVPNDP